jgi:cytochrome c2
MASELSHANYADAPQLQVASMGENLFRTRCAVCHTIGDGNDRIVGGPDLLDVTQRREREWLARWLANPAKMLAEKDPVAWKRRVAECGGRHPSSASRSTRHITRTSSYC